MSVVLPEGPARALPALRLVPAPVSEPPYDDELPPGAVRLRTVPVPLQAPGLPLRLVPQLPDPGAEPEREAPWGPPRTPLDGLAPPRPFAHALVQRLIEVLGGVRPVGQLQRDTSPELYARLERYVAARPRTTGPRPTGRAVRSVHVQARPEGVAEVCATVLRGTRAGALALRLEGVGGRWCCTELVGL